MCCFHMHTCMFYFKAVVLNLVGPRKLEAREIDLIPALISSIWPEANHNLSVYISSSAKWG